MKKIKRIKKLIDIYVHRRCDVSEFEREKMLVEIETLIDELDQEENVTN